MCSILIVLSFLACTSHGRRVQDIQHQKHQSSAEVQRSSQDGVVMGPNALKSLAMLLAADPSAGWQGAGWRASNPRGTGIGISMQSKDIVADDFPEKPDPFLAGEEIPTATLDDLLPDWEEEYEGDEFDAVLEMEREREMMIARWETQKQKEIQKREQYKKIKRGLGKIRWRQRREELRRKMEARRQDQEVRFKNELKEAALSDSQPKTLRLFEEAVDVLKVDLPKILQTDPHWDSFATDFKLIDHTGATVEGLQPTRQMVKMLRRMCKSFRVKDNVKVEFFITDDDPQHFTLVARWRIQLGNYELPFGGVDIPFDIEAKTTFVFNDKNQVASLRIDKWLLNGGQLPDVKLSNDVSTNWEKIKEWGSALTELQRWFTTRDDTYAGLDADFDEAFPYDSLMEEYSAEDDPFAEAELVDAGEVWAELDMKRALRNLRKQKLNQKRKKLRRDQELKFERGGGLGYQPTKEKREELRRRLEEMQKEARTLFEEAKRDESELTAMITDLDKSPV